MAAFAAFGVFYFLLIIGLLGLSIYSFILFVKLANRGIKALDIYLDEKKNNNL